MICILVGWSLRLFELCTYKIKIKINYLITIKVLTVLLKFLDRYLESIQKTGITVKTKILFTGHVLFKKNKLVNKLKNVFFKVTWFSINQNYINCVFEIPT